MRSLLANCGVRRHDKCVRHGPVFGPYSLTHTNEACSTVKDVAWAHGTLQQQTSRACAVGRMRIVYVACITSHASW